MPVRERELELNSVKKSNMHLRLEMHCCTVLGQRRLDTITCTTFFAELAQKLTNEFYVNF